MLVAVRRKRVAIERVHSFLDAIDALPVDVDPALKPAEAQSILTLCKKHDLTAYDATYLQLALKRALPLATLDVGLRKAATAESVLLL